jgi:hypothetical protein
MSQRTASLEEIHSEPTLEIHQMATHRRVRDLQVTRGRSYAACFVNGCEGAQS